MRDASYQAKARAVAAATEKIPARARCRSTWLQPGAYQPRHNFDEQLIEGLAESIKERGILQPLLVRPIAGATNMFEIVAGERRWRAAQLAGLHEVPVVVRELSDRETLEFGLIENVQRQDLSPLEEAEGYRRLLDEFRHTQEDLGKIVGKSRSHIANMMRLLTLAARRQTDDRMKGELSAGHARTLVTAKNPAALAEEIVKKGMNVRQAEALAKQEAENPQIHKKKASADANTFVLEKDLERAIGYKIKIDHKGKAGTITLALSKTLDQLDEIVKRLKGEARLRVSRRHLNQ